MLQTNRRSFLKAGSAAAALSFGRPVPALLQQAAAQSKHDGRVLVVIELAGGNDGLNTVIPFRHDQYAKSRPTLAVAESDVLKINDELGLHPATTGFAELLQQNQLSIVQGVGYDNPNRSHFESMDIWHTCQRKDESRVDGWLGRLLESAADQHGNDPAAMHLGRQKQPFALMSREVRVPTIRSLQQFRLDTGSDQSFRDAVRQLADAGRPESNDLLGFVQSSTSAAIAASERVETANQQYRAAKTYPETELAQQLQTIAQLIDAGLSTSVYYVQLDGFDTHAQQAGAQQSLLRQLSDAVTAFIQDIDAHGHGDRVLCFSFSEFGRRVKENASEGTDHGTAGPVFLAGQSVQSGLVGAHPDLNDLQDGDLRHHTDFRCVYADILQNWMNISPTEILHGNFKPVSAVRPG
ncbi:MAG: DUF1501 domain-containing protein [Fuerstiella sp.]